MNFLITVKLKKNPFRNLSRITWNLSTDLKTQAIEFPVHILNVAIFK